MPGFAIQTNSAPYPHPSAPYPYPPRNQFEAMPIASQPMPMPMAIQPQPMAMPFVNPPQPGMNLGPNPGKLKSFCKYFKSKLKNVR